MNSYKTSGVVLKRINFGEADKIITLYTKDFGKITCIAKGIRKMNSRKKGALEIFNDVSFFAVKGKGMDIVTEVETLNTFSGWRKNLKKIAASYQICEMVDKLTAEGQEQEEIYRLLVSGLERIDSLSEEKIPSLVNYFGENLLKLLGFWPKEKGFPDNFNTSLFMENIMERELKSKKFSRQVS